MTTHVRISFYLFVLFVLYVVFVNIAKGENDCLFLNYFSFNNVCTKYSRSYFLPKERKQILFRKIEQKICFTFAFKLLSCSVLATLTVEVTLKIIHQTF